MRVGFDTERMASFIATRTELGDALGDWRVPLTRPIERLGRNPFTGKLMTLKTRDPGPDVPVTVPSWLPFEHVLLPNEEDWESRYIALDLALAGEDGRAPDFFQDLEAQLAMMAARGLDHHALVGADTLGDPRWVLVVPKQLVRRLAAFEECALGATLEAWNVRSPSTSTLDDLRNLWSLARRAVAQQREMFLWLDAPPHRCPVHRPHRGA
jgi:hypothetical protein